MADLWSGKLNQDFTFSSLTTTCLHFCLNSQTPETLNKPHKAFKKTSDMTVANRQLSPLERAAVRGSVKINFHLHVTTL